MVSLNNLASLRDFESKVGARRHRRRFRAQYLVQRRAGLGGAGLDRASTPARRRGAAGAEGIVRCPATEVNPETGERDANPVAEFRQLTAISNLGFMRGDRGRRFAIGDAIEVLGT